MINDIRSLLKEIGEKLPDLKNSEQLEQFRLEYIVKKGKIQALMQRMKDVAKADKPLVGKE
ncbi:MAG: phenylalanine--tRNA ligase subunit alpha, partial [Chlorobi bacterium]|nr:phenylalanine--tRNA ligase subunit alpha [Chlorobiota bacterium]